MGFVITGRLLPDFREMEIVAARDSGTVTGWEIMAAIASDIISRSDEKVTLHCNGPLFFSNVIFCPGFDKC
jgi:hypothetical protein